MADMRRIPLLLPLALACTAGPSAPEAPAEAEARATAPLVELDRRGERVLRGEPLPVLAHSDAGRVLRLQTDADGPLGGALEGLEVQDARFVGFGVVVIDAEQRLVAYDEAGHPRTLDEGAYGPLSVAAGVVAYTHGAPPDLELRRAYPSRGLVEPLTEGMAPVWSPALDGEGREVLFVSGAGGQPRLHRMDAAGAIAALPRSARVPSSPSAPLWRGAELVFADERGVARVHLPTGEVIEALDGARAPALDDHGALTARLGDARVRLGGDR